MRAQMVMGHDGVNQTRTHCKGGTQMAQSAATAQSAPITSAGAWPAGLVFPYVREPNDRADLPLPAFLRS